MIKSFFWSRKWALWAYCGAIVLMFLIYAQVSMSVRMNTWYGGFYDILQHLDQHTYAEFKQKLIDFSWIAVPWTILAVITNYLTRRYSLWWREAITFNFIPRWRNVVREIEGASQRIQEDPYRYAKIIESLGLQVARAIMTLVAFLPILWSFSKAGIVVPLAGTAGGQFAWFLLLGSFAVYLSDKIMRVRFTIGFRSLANIVLNPAIFSWLKKSLPELTVVLIVVIAALWEANIYRGWIGWILLSGFLLLCLIRSRFPCLWARGQEIVWSTALTTVLVFIQIRVVTISFWRLVEKPVLKTLWWLDVNAPELTTVAIVVVAALWESGVYRGAAGWILCIAFVIGFITPVIDKNRPHGRWVSFWFLRMIIYSLALVVSWVISNSLNTGLPSFVWVAIFVSFGGTLISWFVGIKLPGLEYNNQKVEAALRKELVLGEDDKINHSSVPTLTELFVGIKFNYRRLFWHYGYFDLWSNTFGQIMVVVPFLIAGPALFSGLITLGVLIQIDNAFGKVQNSFSLFMDNWTTITELRSIRKRLYEFERNLDKHQVVV